MIVSAHWRWGGAVVAVYCVQSTYVTVGLVSQIQQRNHRNQPTKMETKLNKILYSFNFRKWSGFVLFLVWCTTAGGWRCTQPGPTPPQPTRCRSGTPGTWTVVLPLPAAAELLNRFTRWILIINHFKYQSNCCWLVWLHKKLVLQFLSGGKRPHVSMHPSRVQCRT